MKTYKKIAAGSLFLLMATMSYAQQSERLINPEQDIVALYESRQIKLAIRPQTAKQQWQFWRAKNKVEKYLIKEKKLELWEKNDHEIFFSHAFPELKRMVEYNTGDLRSLGQEPEWPMIEHIIDPKLLDTLQKTGESELMGYKTTLYKGQLNGADFEVSWINELQLPALIRQVHRNVIYSVHLLEIYSQDESPWKKLNTEGFLTIDYADLGDNEADPVWASLGEVN